MLVLNNSHELATTYLQVFLLWMFCSELVLSFACVYFVVTGHFIPVWGLSILRANLASTEKSAAGKLGLTQCCQHCGFPANLGLFFVELRVFLKACGLLLFRLISIDICLFFGLFFCRFMFCGFFFQYLWHFCCFNVLLIKAYWVCFYENLLILGLFFSDLPPWLFI